MNYAEVRFFGRLSRAVFGALLVSLLWIGNPHLTSQTLGVAGYLVGVVIFYVLLTVLLGQRVLSRVNPWIGAAIMYLPLVVAFTLPFADLLRFAVLVFVGLSLIFAGLFRYGGCELLAISNGVLRKRYRVACVIFSPLDWLEYRLWRRSNPPRNSA